MQLQQCWRSIAAENFSAHFLPQSHPEKGHECARIYTYKLTAIKGKDSMTTEPRTPEIEGIICIE